MTLVSFEMSDEPLLVSVLYCSKKRPVGINKMRSNCWKNQSVAPPCLVPGLTFFSAFVFLFRLVWEDAQRAVIWVTASKSDDQAKRGRLIHWRYDYLPPLSPEGRPHYDSKSGPPPAASVSLTFLPVVTHPPRYYSASCVTTGYSATTFQVFLDTLLLENPYRDQRSKAAHRSQCWGWCRRPCRVILFWPTFVAWHQAPIPSMTRKSRCRYLSFFGCRDFAIIIFLINFAAILNY